MAVNTFSFVLAEADSPNVTGSWKIEITFANDQHRFLRFDAQNDGKGTLTVTDPQSKVWTGTQPSEAKWTPGDGNSVTFSGPAEFLIGNVGRDAGTLTLKGKFATSRFDRGRSGLFAARGRRTFEARDVQSYSRKKIARASRILRRGTRARTTFATFNFNALFFNGFGNRIVTSGSALRHSVRPEIPASGCWICSKNR